MPVSIMRLIHNRLTRLYPKLKAEYEEESPDSIHIDSIFCVLDVNQEGGVFSWSIWEGYDPLVWEDDDQYMSDRDLLGGMDFEPGNPDWDIDKEVRCMVRCLEIEGLQHAHKWHQVRVEQLNEVGRAIAQLKKQVIEKKPRKK